MPVVPTRSAADDLADLLPAWLDSRDLRGQDEQDFRAARQFAAALDGARRRGELGDWILRNRDWGRRVLGAVGVPGVVADGSRLTASGALFEESRRCGFRYMEKHNANG